MNKRDELLLTILNDIADGNEYAMMLIADLRDELTGPSQPAAPTSGAGDTCKGGCVPLCSKCWVAVQGRQRASTNDPADIDVDAENDSVAFWRDKFERVSRELLDLRRGAQPEPQRDGADHAECDAAIAKLKARVRETRLRLSHALSDIADLRRAAPDVTAAVEAERARWIADLTCAVQLIPANIRPPRFDQFATATATTPPPPAWLCSNCKTPMNDGRCHDCDATPPAHPAGVGEHDPWLDEPPTAEELKALQDAADHVNRQTGVESLATPEAAPTATTDAPAGFRVVGKSGPMVPHAKGTWIQFALTYGAHGSPRIGPPRQDDPNDRWWGSLKEQRDAGCYLILEPIATPPAEPPRCKTWCGVVPAKCWIAQHCTPECRAAGRSLRPVAKDRTP